MKRLYLLEFHANMRLNTHKIHSENPKEAVETCMKSYNYPCNVINVNDISQASVKVTLLNGKRKTVNYYVICYTGFDVKNMSMGLRRGIGFTLTNDEINEIKKEIKVINADEHIFVFNDKIHIRTCYVAASDLIYIGSDIFPDIESASRHPRDLMSIRAVLAHEYYGHRPHRQEYMNDANTGKDTIPQWRDEFRADYEAAQKAPGLDRMDRYHLIQSAVLRAEEAGQFIKMDDFMREVLYGRYN